METNLIKKNSRDIDPLVKKAVSRVYYHMEKDFDETRVNAVIDLIYATWPKIKNNELLQGLSNGVSGKFGRTPYFNSQELMLWIRCTLERKRPDDYRKTPDRL